MKTARSLGAILGVWLCLANAFAGPFTAPTNSPAKPDVKMKPCFQCKGLGKAVCTTCRGTGMMACPGNCLQLTKGVWEHRTVENHPATDLWIKFYYKDNTWLAFNQNHVGDVVVMKDGQWTDIGKCPTCSGAGKVKCTVCKASGQMVCSLCEGKKMIPEAWTAFDNPKMKSRPHRFTLKNGKVLVGRKGMVMGGTTTIKTEMGSVDVDNKDIVSDEAPSDPK